MKTIRILTFWGVPNYGCFLQAYALQKVLANINPSADVKHIAYLNHRHYNAYYGLDINHDFRYKIINPYFYKSIFNELKNYKSKKKLRRYLEYYEGIPHTAEYKYSDLSNLNIDTLVLGSDIIWDFENRFLNGDKALFGIGINATKKISYAPSICNSALAEKIPSYVVEGLRELDALSVRDNPSAQVVERIAQRNVKVVLDPTFLYDFRGDESVIHPQIGERYIAVYGNHFTEEMIKEIKAFSSETGIKLVNLDFYGKVYDWCDINLERDKMTPFEWLGYIMDSEYLLTSTFHGLIFGLQFEKKIAFVPTEFIVNKAGDLINYLDLEDVLMNYSSVREKLDWEWDYSVISPKIKELKEQSMKFLYDNV